MKTILLFKNLAFLFIVLMMSTICFSQNISDTEWKFKINIPYNWSKQSHMDGADKIYDYNSPDQNAAVQLRVFEATPQLTLDLLCQAYESNYLPAGTRKQSLVNHTSANGIPGKQGSYILNYNNIEVAIAIFYVVKNSKGYVLNAMIPTSLINTYGEEVKAITKSFTIDGFGNSSQTQAKSSSSGLAGLMNKQKDKQQVGSSNNSSIVGRYMYDYSTGDKRTNYNNIYIYQNGSYKHEYQLKSSDNYIGGSEGAWQLNGNILTLTHKGGYQDTYTVNGRKLIRTTDDGQMVYFKE